MVEMFEVTILEYGRELRLTVIETLKAAKDLALRRVDDALPRNTVRVGDSKGVEVGYAYFGGDGGSYWKTTDVIGLKVLNGSIKVMDLIKWMEERDASCAEYLLPELRSYMDELLKEMD